MRRHIIAPAAVSAIILLSCLAAQAQGVQFVTPQDGDTVRGVVQLQATKQNPDDGWISYKIQPAADDRFAAAVTKPFIYLWDTRARDEKGGDVYGDGQYTLTAVALSGSGRKAGEASITVTVKNALAASEAPQQAVLDLFYDRNKEVRYHAEGSWTMKAAADEEEPDDVYERAKEFDGALVANWKNKTMSPTFAAGHAVLHVVVGSSGAQAGSSEVEALDHAGEALTYIALRDGEMRRKHSDEPRFELAEVTIPLPEGPIRIGQTWRGPISIWPDPLKGTMKSGGMGMDMMGMDMMAMEPEMMMAGPGMEADMGGGATAQATAPTDFQTRTVQATHKAEAFEWVQGHKTVRIRSTYSVDDDKITIPGGGAGALGMEGEIFGGVPGEPMPGGFGDEMAGMEAGGMGGGAGTELETSYVGERITYWAYELRRPVRIVDSITHTLEVPRQTAGMGEFGMEAEMMGMGFDEAMPPTDEMMPPGFEGAPRGMWDEGMGEFGMGEFGMGEMQQQEPMKVNIHVRLTIQEVGL